MADEPWPEALVEKTASAARDWAQMSDTARERHRERIRDALDASGLREAQQEAEDRAERQQEILDWLQNEIGTAYNCDDCGHSTYHAFANECAECGNDFPTLHMLAFKLNATHPSGNLKAERDAALAREPHADMPKSGFDVGNGKFTEGDEVIVEGLEEYGVGKLTAVFHDGDAEVTFTPTATVKWRRILTPEDARARGEAP